MSGLNGVLPVDKPSGPTSHDVVATARRALKLRRIGHTGTLDPFASGLLLLCLGPATRIAEYLTSLDKSYAATVRLGIATDTDDHTGEPVSVSEGWRELTEGQVREALEAQTGTILQTPPAYSAKKVAGERMYAAARRGEVVERTPVSVTIHSIRITRFELPELDLEIDCGSGTYIRAIARDLGEALGVGAHLTALRRTRVGRFEVGSALAMEALGDEQAVRAALLAPAEALSHLPAVTLNEVETSAVLHGRAVAAPESVPSTGPLVLLSGQRELVAVAERSGAKIRPRKVFA
ncbi:MAG TPA: tRNA pseudouridine(55) synthase TruB [Longimicrobiaceae bacterium]